MRIESNNEKKIEKVADSLANILFNQIINKNKENKNKENEDTMLQNK